MEGKPTNFGHKTSGQLPLTSGQTPKIILLSSKTETDGQLKFLPDGLHIIPFTPQRQDRSAIQLLPNGSQLEVNKLPPSP